MNINVGGRRRRLGSAEALPLLCYSEACLREEGLEEPSAALVARGVRGGTPLEMSVGAAEGQ